MAETEIPNQVKRFVNDYISTAQQLDVLLLLSKDPGKEWASEEVASSLGMLVTSAGNRLISLWIKGLLVVRESPARVYRYRPKTKEIEAAVTLLHSLYQSDRAAVLELIAASFEARMRDLSDAFKFREDDENG